MLLNLLNLFSLIIALFKKIYSMNQQLDVLRHCGSQEKGLRIANATTKYLATTVPSIFQTATSELFSFSTMSTVFTENLETTTKNCHDIAISCSKFLKSKTKSMILTTMAINFSSTILPEITSQLNGNEINGTTFFPTMDYMNGSTTIDFDLYAENSTERNYTTMTVDLSSMYPMTSTTELPFESFTNNEATIEDDDYNYDGDYPSGESDSQRVRRSDRNSNDIYNMTNDDYDNTTIFDTNNITELISSTVSSFLENITVTLDPNDESTISQLWTEYLSTISTTENDRFNANDDDDDDDEVDPNIPAVCINNLDGVYYPECNDTDDDLTTPMITYVSPDELREPDTSVPTFNDNSANALDKTLVISTINESQSATNATFFANSINENKTKECVPFVKNRGDNITGIPPEYVGAQLSKTIQTMNQQNQQKLRDLCWETLFGQELVKLTVLDLIFTIFATLFMDFFRALFVRFMNKCWCWDLEKKFPKVMSDFLNMIFTSNQHISNVYFFFLIFIGIGFVNSMEISKLQKISCIW